ncbi:MAG: ABC transporter ATP-binding protein/permease [Oscillospiraceae bacterium]|nr:ABC transporter ATP-binding protein/permease [Oscillospiraceae bacterium]
MNNETENNITKKEKTSVLKTWIRIIPISYKATPLDNTINNIMALVHGGLFAVTVIATQYLFDAITEAAAGRADFWDCFYPLLILSGVTFGTQILNGIHNFHADVLFKKASGRLMTLLHDKFMRVDPARFEDTDFLDDVNKAREGVYTLPYVSMSLSIFILFYGTYFAAIGSYLFNLKPILLITLLVAFIPAMLAQLVRIKVFTKLEEQSAPLRREFEYYQKTMCDREYFKETRILGAYKFFHKLFSETLVLLSHKTWKAERKTALLQLTLNISTFAGMAFASYLLFAATMAGEISVGAFAAVFSALGMIFYIMQEIFDMHMSNINKEIGKLANFVRMMDLPERTGADEMPEFEKGIIAENVTFTYPGRDEPAVKNVSLSVNNGETIAIVGENGAGKSTLVRLLTGVYRPSEGEVIVGGLNTSFTSPASIYERISGVFQKYQRYKMTLAENVIISDIGSDLFVNPDASASSSKFADSKFDDCDAKNLAIDTALSEAHFDMDEVKHDTMLSPEFDGIDLSGGQWQRLAIARGLYRKNDFIVLDEPTAAIDPIEEARVYTQFQKLAEGKSAVIVTHRLGSAKLAHRIIVMDAGEIIATGTHDELIAAKGKYADMWSAQAMWYEREPDMV